MLSPILFMAIIGGTAWLYFGDMLGSVLLGICLAVGVVLGILWTRKIRKRESYSTFYSHVNASPDIEKIEK